MTIRQVAVNDKSNEIPATQALIALLNVKGTLVAADALNCQKKTAQAIINGGGDCMFEEK
jgi:predicted transposase YbfD/YdcC